MRSVSALDTLNKAGIFERRTILTASTSLAIHLISSRSEPAHLQKLPASASSPQSQSPARCTTCKRCSEHGVASMLIFAQRERSAA
jgi:hypothetical protein